MYMPYKEKRVQLPTPRFVVFYNGEKEMPEKWELRLSDAFTENLGTMELVVTVYNINYAENREILERCHDLKSYSIFVARVRDAVKTGTPLKKAIIDTIHYCKENDILADYFAQKEQEEVIDMVSFKWDPELAKKTWMEEAREDGLEEGRKEGRKEGVFQTTLTSIRNLMETVHWTAQQAMDALKIPANEREKYVSQL